MLDEPRVRRQLAMLREIASDLEIRPAIRRSAETLARECESALAGGPSKIASPHKLLLRTS
jgi:hypothetical protein